MPSSKYEANPMLHLRVRFTSAVSLFPLASSCSNDYFCAYTIIYFLANLLVFPYTVTYSDHFLFPYFFKSSVNLNLFIFMFAFAFFFTCVYTTNAIVLLIIL